MRLWYPSICAPFPLDIPLFNSQTGVFSHVVSPSLLVVDKTCLLWGNKFLFDMVGGPAFIILLYVRVLIGRLSTG